VDYNEGDDGVAVALVEPYANHLQLAPDRQPRHQLNFKKTYLKVFLHVMPQ